VDTAALVEVLVAKSVRLATAESCTAGLIASTLADAKGAGELLECAFVTYSPGAKLRCLGVRAETLAQFNLTSEEVAREMAEGALRASDATLAVANTGVTDDVDPDIPAGTQCYAWAFRNGDRPSVVFSETRRFQGDRNGIRQQSADHALSRIPHWHAQFESITAASA
jgi:nicotinamide-nucleotide amidase